MYKTGNLFELAERQLIKEKQAGIIPCYTEDDVIDYAILIRKWLDDNPKKVSQVMKLTRKELIKNRKKTNREYYLKNRR